MQRFVIDTSVLACAFIISPNRDKVNRILANAMKGSIKLYAPTLLWHELFSVIVQNYDDAQIAFIRMKKFESLIDKGLIEIVKNRDVLESAVKIAFNQENGKLGFISPADAFFHSTALHVEGVFLTNDKKHYNKTKDTIGKILLLEDY